MFRGGALEDALAAMPTLDVVGIILEGTARGEALTGRVGQFVDDGARGRDGGGRRGC